MGASRMVNHGEVLTTTPKDLVPESWEVKAGQVGDGGGLSPIVRYSHDDEGSVAGRRSLRMELHIGRRLQRDVRTALPPLIDVPEKDKSRDDRAPPSDNIRQGQLRHSLM